MTRSRATAHPGTLQTSTKVQSHVTGRAQRRVRDLSIASLLWRVPHGPEAMPHKDSRQLTGYGAYYGRTCRRVKTNHLLCHEDIAGDFHVPVVLCQLCVALQQNGALLPTFHVALAWSPRKGGRLVALDMGDVLLDLLL